MTVGYLVNKLLQFDQTLPVYITACKTDEDGMAGGEARLEFPNPVLSRMDPEQEAELPEEARLGEFVLLEPEDA